jgi:threonyl-tRNA synthetase
MINMLTLFSILTEHFAGRWPFWLSPRQVMVIPVMPSANDYVKEVQAALRKQHLHADIDISGNTMQKKIRTAQLSLYNFIMVVGAEEQEKRAVNWRNRDDQETQQRGVVVPLDEAIKKLVELRDERKIENRV